MATRRSAADKTPAGQLTEARLHDLIGYQLAQAAIATTAVYNREVFGPDGLRPVEYTLLTLIAENPEVSSARLAKALVVTKPNITMWVDRLEARKLLQRRPSPSDKRAVLLKLTAAGSRMASSATRRLLKGERDAMAVLSAAERALLIELLHKVARSRPQGPS